MAWTHEWGGWLATTKDHLPMLLSLGENAYARLGYNGRGVAMSTVMGRELAKAVLGEDPAFGLRPLRPFALHPLRQIAISHRLTVGGALDAFERRGAASR